MHRADPRFFQPVSVRPIVLREEDGGKRTATISVSTAAAIATAMAPKVVERFPDGTTRIIAAPPEPPQPPFQDVALAVLDDDVVDKALAFYSHTDNWAVNLYKVYEIVGLDVEETRLSRKSTFNDDKGRFITNSWKEIARRAGRRKERRPASVRPCTVPLLSATKRATACRQSQDQLTRMIHGAGSHCHGNVRVLSLWRSPERP
jgi:hypothetical protein